MSNERKPSKGHKLTARELAMDVLTRVEQEGAYSNLQLNAGLQRASLIREDAALATELVYGSIARLNTLDYFLRPFVSKGMDKLQPWVRSLLRMSLYQLMYLDRIPPHAVVNEAVNIAKSRGHQGISGMVNGVLRSVIRGKDDLILPEGLTPLERISLEQSHPRWLVKRWIKQYGEQTAEAICAANNEPPSISVRVNTTMISREKLLQEMSEHGMEVIPSPLTSVGILVKSGGNMALTDWYRDGFLSVQDESSMLVGEAVGSKPGMRVLDCCAAPGGKSVHIAELMKDDGVVIANDQYPHKEKLIREQAERLGLDSIETTVGDALNLGDKYAEASFDRILLDAPCSGLGVIRRKPDLKWTKTTADIEEIASLQYEMLEKISPLLKVGGILVYSTCTIEPQENEEMISRFLDNHPEFGLPVDEPSSWSELHKMTGSQGQGIQILPQHFRSDGFFIARMQRNS
ncbi:16S rRNA (cytosine(967)-C(5))-methyltransferase RsmB [Paenibacillus macquariensis]|uniref:16S rRNA (cytosine(967)-C(5))-methyltransferase n=1 Tax=Paenibacillus macquariensis TaxID=948756 RepID=A0ABY1JLD2_9BACL|nr:16S rRNA (cytosine(967)-C(5))-methyltransferase RsmB [Paenibacillus macquariensis]MEC0090052.1 16S rRNA (cytosine(967)-C(5))-methyltransferase RsmB [Paenibacillus macquariensis]SIQ36800.1 16S rRNA (cytosine967-C5)-methyltransferase [Paenibacillus macquariensis]